MCISQQSELKTITATLLDDVNKPKKYEIDNKKEKLK